MWRATVAATRFTAFAAVTRTAAACTRPMVARRGLAKVVPDFHMPNLQSPSAAELSEYPSYNPEDYVYVRIRGLLRQAISADILRLLTDHDITADVNDLAVKYYDGVRSWWYAKIHPKDLKKALNFGSRMFDSRLVHIERVSHLLYHTLSDAPTHLPFPLNP
jgi:hypothetical protein